MMPNTRSQTGAKVWYDGGKGAEVYPAPVDRTPQVGHIALTDEATTPMHGTTRCSCADCLAEREEIRSAGLSVMRATLATDEDWWADVSWNDPVNRFPGAQHGDGSHHPGGRQ